MNVNQVPGPRDAKGVFSTINDSSIRWTDKANRTHKVEGADVIPAGIGGGVRLLWTKCERNVPSGEAFLHVGWDGPFDMCPICVSK